MDFLEADIDNLFPVYYDQETKERIKAGLDGFYSNRGKDFDYPAFYTTNFTNWLLQADILNSFKTIDWDKDGNISEAFTAGMLISNTCDVDKENVRNANQKQALVAPLLELNSYFEELKNRGFNDERINILYKDLKDQRLSNILFLPSNFINEKEYLVWLDKITWLPTTQLNGGYNSVFENRFISLTNWAFYLFIFKLTFHLARLGEDDDGRIN